MADMNLDEIMAKSRELYEGAQTVSSISGARQAAMTAASLVYYTAKALKTHLATGAHTAGGGGTHAAARAGAKKDDEGAPPVPGKWLPEDEIPTHGIGLNPTGKGQTKGSAPTDKVVPKGARSSEIVDQSEAEKIDESD